MNPEIKTAWVDALRSGEYTQGRRALQVNGEFCCLGVLCDLAVKAGANVHVAYEENFVTYDSCKGMPPLSVRAWAGISTDDGDIVDDGDEVFGLLADRNDRGDTFALIAEIIEERL